MIPNYTQFPLPGRMYDYFLGPVAYGQAQEAEYADRWALWQAGDGIRIGKRRKTYSPDTYGDVFPIEISEIGLTHLSGAFDYTAYCQIAASTAENFTIYADDGAAGDTYGPFEGTSALMWFDGLLQRNEALQDIVCIYMKPFQHKLFGRFQRDSYSIEYELAVLNFIPRWLQKCDVVNFWYFRLWGRTLEERQFEVTSNFYQPKALTFTGAAAGAGAIQSAVIFDVIVSGGTFTGAASGAADGVQSAVLLDVIIDGGTFYGAAQGAAEGIQSVVLFDAIVTGGSFAGACTATANGVQSVVLATVVPEVKSFTGAAAGNADGIQSVLLETV